MSDAVFLGPGVAIQERSPAEDPRDLFWMRREDRFELAVEVSLPAERRQRLRHGAYARARYELAIGRKETGEPSIVAETFWLIGDSPPRDGGDRDAVASQRTLFPDPPSPPETIVRPAGKKAPRGWKKIVNKVAESGSDYPESGAKQ